MKNPKQSNVEKAARLMRPTHSAYLLHLLHKSWPNDEIELVKANYTARGVEAKIKDLNDNRVYTLETYPDD